MARPPKARAPLKRAALELFVDRGVHATGIRDIAKHAGCSEAALYRHWTNKDEMVLALFTEHLAEVVGLLDAAIAGEKRLEAQVRAACQAAYQLYDDQPLVFRFVLLIQHELARTLPDSLRMPQDVVIDMLDAAIKRGELKGDPVLLAAALIGLFLETATFVIYGRLPGPLAQHADSVATLSLRVLLAPRALRLPKGA